MSAAARLLELGLVLPEAPAPAGSYVPVKRTGSLIYVAGQLPVVDGALLQRGRLGESVSVEEGAELARICALNALAQVDREVGSIDSISQVVRVGGFVACAPAFEAQPAVINGASNLLLALFGEAGRHARVAVGVSVLPLGAPVEIEFLFEIAR